MSVNKKEVKIFLIALDDLLYAVPTFSNEFARLTTELKSQLVIADISLDLAQAHLQIHKYDSDQEVELFPPYFVTSSRTGTPPLVLELALNL